MNVVFSILVVLLLVCCTVSSNEDVDPMLDLLLEHNERAAAMLFDFTTHTPTMEPTAEPSAEPTAEPTASPTFVPSNVLSVSPTLEPSTAPTNPTAVPTVAPTNPTATPTVPPTARPTRVPTVKPTRVPTIEPTANPTPQPGDPTLSPTPAPTTAKPTAIPTPAPTAQNSPILIFNTTFALGGVLTPSLDESSQLAVIAATAESMDISTSTVTYLSDTSTVEGARRLMTRDGNGNAHLRVINLFATTYAVAAVTQVAIPLSATSFTNATDLYNNLAGMLEEAVLSGAFTDTLRNASLVYNASAVADASATSVMISAPVVQTFIDPVDDDQPGKSEDDDELNAGEIAGVVIGIFVFVALIAAGVYYWLFVRQKDFERREVFAHNSEVEISL